ncbi:MAG TPA: FkbM family methyltransferase [Puia sp.]
MATQKNELYEKCKAKQIPLKHVCEIGVNAPGKSNILDFIRKDKIRATLIEPDEHSIAAIRQFFDGYTNVTLFPYAIYDYNGVLELAQRGESTFATALPFSPAMVNDRYKVQKEDTFQVVCRRFDDLDDGTIDLLSIDTEGCEWYALKYLKSRPLVISLETHGKEYSNPYLNEILDWMHRNGYKRWFITKSDSVYYKDGVFVPDTADERNLRSMDRYIRFRKFRKQLVNRLKFGKRR